MLYHEKQVAALCGVHCLNTLLQGPYFSEIDLAQIAQGLDELERALVGEGALEEASGNVAMDGMFSIQVLSRALETWSLQVISLESEEARAFKAAPTTAEAFICNLQEHWFTLRRVAGGDWWNFNSLFPAPQPLSTFYLQAFLDSLTGEGWTIFVVAGKLPAALPGSLDAPPSAGGRWWSPEEARAATDEAERARKRGRVAHALEGALARAEQQGGRMTLRSRGEPAGGGGGAAAGTSHDRRPIGLAGSDSEGDGDDDDADLAAAIAASLQHHQHHKQQDAAQAPNDSVVSQQQVSQQQPQGAWQQLPGGMEYEEGGFEDDPELAAAIAASLADAAGGPAAAQVGSGSGGEGAGREKQQEGNPAAAGGVSEPTAVQLDPEPEEGEGVIEVAFRLPSGSRTARRFRLSSPSGQLFAFLAPQLGTAPTGLALSTTFPKKELPCSPETSLAELGLTHRTLLVAEIKK
ncbi:hypothetical protein Agub_g10709 [Astrephomene gubernaculifera]|uniref:Ataxin-3 homolog n=1 Tax=Astrephomene gubernaculifera TaxID=47775 RepID=A0AAD3DZS7_9CHLO|nr:hypothetical protein Agub_g10709 [Astrephomene gubernaculifera]